MDNVSNDLSDGKNNMSNMLKEMLKISGTIEPPSLDENNHAGAGDAMSQSNKDSVVKLDYSPTSDSKPVSLFNNSPDDSNPPQTILLEEVADGECVQLVGLETKIVGNVNTELDASTSASNKVNASTITKFEWEHCYYPGNLLSVTHMYMAYSIKGRINNSVRVINRQNSSDRVLLKGFSGFVTDLAFSHSTSNMLAAVDDMGNLMVWNLEQVAGNMVPELKLHLTRDDVTKSGTHRLVWIPHVQTDQSDKEQTIYDTRKSESESDVHTLVLFYSTIAEVWDLDVAFQLGSASDNSKLLRSEAAHAYVAVTDYDDEITDCELSPVGNVLAAASYDGYVKFWQVNIEDTEPPLCLHQWRPHNGMPVASIRFCDDKKQTELSVYWRFLLTGADRNIELKVWCTVTWNCLQVVSFAPPSPAHAVPEMNLIHHHSSNYLILSDIHRKVLYVLDMKANIEQEQARISSIVYFKLASPLLSIAMIDAESCKLKNDSDKANSESDQDINSESDDESKDDDQGYTNGILVRLLTIQQRCLQNLDVRFVPCNPPSRRESLSAPANGNTTAEDIRDQISLSSADEPEPSTQVSTAISEEQLLASGDCLTSPKITGNTASDDVEKDDVEPEATAADHQKTPNLLVKIDIPDSQSSDSPQAPHSSNPAVLLTPDAFLPSSNTPGRIAAESINTSFTSVTPFSNAAESFYQQNQDDTIVDNEVGKAANLDFSSPVVNEEHSRDPEDEEGLRTPPSSPILPQATSSSPPSQAAAAAEILQSFCSTSRSSVKSPDLIASTAQLDDAKHETPGSNLTQPQPPPGLSKRIAPATTSFLREPAEVLPSIILPLTSSGGVSTWPKAPDVTMSHPLTSKSPQTSSIQPVSNHMTRSNDPSTSRDTATNQEMAVVAVPVDPFAHEEVLKSLRAFQEKQESLFNEQQRKLEAITKKQNQAQKQSDTSMKRSDQNAEKLEKSIKSLGDNHRRLANDIKANQSAVTDAAVAKIDRVVKAEMKRTILPGVTSCIDEMKDQLSSSVAKQLTATDAVLKDTIGKQMKSKDFVDRIATESSKMLSEQIQTSLSDVFFRTVVPSFERSCQNMFQQLSATYHRGMDESVKQLEKQMQYRLRGEYDRMQQVTKDANDAIAQLQAASKSAQVNLTSNIHKQFSESIEKLLSGFEERITSNILQSVKVQQTKDQSENLRLMCDAVRDVVEKTISEKIPASKLDPETTSSSQISRDHTGRRDQAGGAVMQQTNMLNQQQKILQLLFKGNYNAAFQTALTAADLSLMNYVIEMVEPSSVFDITPCPLQQPILLSLIQQLSSDLSTKTAIKLKYLQEAVMNLDSNHQVTHEYMHSVLGALVQSLMACLQGPLEDLSLTKDIKMLAMAAQSFMK